MKKENTFHFGWVIVGVCFITLALVYGVWYSFSVFFVALLKEFGWSRSIGAGAFSVFIILSGVVGPYAGNMVYSAGSRNVIIFGSLLLGAGLALCSTTQTWWQFYIFFSIITAVGLGTTGWVPIVTLIQQWFKEKRGLPIGVVSSGIGIGILICIPSIQYLITWVGWRRTYQIMAIFIPLIIISMAIAFLKRPPPTTLPSLIEIGTSGRSRKDPLIVNEEWASRPWTVRQALTTRQFWLATLSAFLGSLVIQSIFTHQVVFFVDHGLEALLASYIVGFVGVVSIGGKIIWGVLSDKIGREVSYTAGIICIMVGMISLILFDLFPSSSLPYFYAFFFGIGYAVQAALPPLIMADFFEGPGYGGIFGWQMLFVGIGGAFGAWFAGFLYDQVESYLPVFVIMMVCAFFSCLGIWWAAPGKIRMVPGKSLR